MMPMMTERATLKNVELPATGKSVASFPIRDCHSWKMFLCIHANCQWKAVSIRELYYMKECQIFQGLVSDSLPWEAWLAPTKPIFK